MPRGSVLGPVLFIICVNNLPAEVKSYCKLFADDTKLYKELSGLQDHEILLIDMFGLCNWTMKWLRFFNSITCKIMHIGNNNPKFSYKLLGKNKNIVDIKTVDHKKDLGVIFQEDLKFEQHICYTVNKAKIEFLGW